MIAMLQRDGTDCGAVCLATIADHYGLKCSVAYLRAHIGTSLQGSTALGLVQAARKLGLNAIGVKGTIAQASTAPLPAIAHCLLDERIAHFVVVTKIESHVVELMDPAKGEIIREPVTSFLSMWTGVLILFEPGGQLSRGRGGVSTRYRLWSIISPHRNAILLTVLIAAGVALLTLGAALCIQVLLDDAIPAHNGTMLHRVGLGLIALVVARLTLTGFQTVLVLRTTAQIDTSLMMGYYRHLLRLPQMFYDTMRLGEITSRLSDAAKVRSFINTSLLSLLLNPLIIAFSLSGMWFYSAKLALSSLVLLPLGALLYWMLTAYTQTAQRELMERAGAFGAQLTESLAAQSVIRRFGLETKTERITQSKFSQLLMAVRRSSLVALVGRLSTAFVTHLYLVGVIWFGATMVFHSTLTLGELMASCALAACLIGPFASLIALSTSIQDALIATERLFEIMDLDRESDPGERILPTRHAAQIHLVDVSFHYAGRRAALSDVSVSFPDGTITVLSGPSGCGKSSLLALIQRLYRPDSGTISIGDNEVSAYSLESYRRAVAVVPQSTVLLSGTVLDNLVPSDPQPDMRRLFSLCRDVGILDTIESLPKGFMTYLTENGLNLSGGQRQRLALVRALYLKTPFILLDEPTASLDAASEEKILLLLKKIRDEGRTIIIAAHHPALLSCADRIVEMRDGRVVGITSRG